MGPTTTAGYNTGKPATFPPRFCGPSNRCWRAVMRDTPAETGWIASRVSDLMRFLSSNFTYYFILFPKCFSSFPHGTCSLSVSRQYLALDGIYHRIRAAFPNNSTRGERTTDASGGYTVNRIVTLYDTASEPIWCRPTRVTLLETTTRTLKAPDFKVGLRPLHSPLLGPSWLFSFPPLIDMLKFSG